MLVQWSSAVQTAAPVRVVPQYIVVLRNDES
jgi:hypothetical protein